MKKQTLPKKKLLIAIFSTLSLTTFAQGHWILGGNGTAPPPDNVTLPGKNFLGSITPFNTWLQFGVNSNQDIFVDNNPNQLLPAGTGNPGVLQGGHWVGLGRVFRPNTGLGANPALEPKAHLHIHGGNVTGNPNFTTGIRNWMQTGTLYTENSNGMYVGLKDLSKGTPNSLNSSYAVINWADDNFGGTATDFLTFNFTSSVSNPLANSTDGMEMGRFNPTPGQGTFGVGNFMFMGTYTDPVRRVEILDADPATGNNANAPQMRLTYRYNSNAASGIFSEFQSTNLGDLYINTHDFTKAAPYSDRFTGFHTITPKNTVEINSQLTNATSNDVNVPASWAGSTGASGLRFSDLTSASTVVPPTPVVYDPTKVLSVDQNGDVILINSAGTPPTNNGITTLPAANGGPAIQLGVACNQLLTGTLFAQASLTTNRILPLVNNNFSFIDGPAGTGKMGIGNIASLCNPGNTLELGSDAGSLYPITPPTGIGSSGLRFTHLTSAFTPIANGVNGVNNTKVLTVDGNGDVVLVTPASNNNNSGCCVGGYCNVTPTPLSSPFGIPLNGSTYTFYGPGQVSVTDGNCFPPNLGKLFVSDQGSAASALYATQLLTNPGFYAGYFNGNIYGNGISTTAGNLITSDSTLKTNVTPITTAMATITQLKPKSFYYDTTNTKGFKFPSKKQYGFLAQNVKAILPELTSTFYAPNDSARVTPYSSVNYTGLIGLLTAGLQEQQNLIDSLKKKFIAKDSVMNARLNALENALKSCCSNAAGTRNAANIAVQNVELSDANTVVLNQNQPNPFAEQTTITYNIPQSAGIAQLLFYDINGKQIQNVNITAKGRGQLNVYANDLTNGVYSYTLIVDGKIIDTKKMIKQQ